MADLAPPWFELGRTGARLRLVQGRALVAAALVVVAWWLVTMFTGAPGPGPLRRFPVADLHALADAVNAPPSSCRASVGLVSSRVVIELGFPEEREVRLTTCAAQVARAIDADSSRFSPEMVAGDVRDPGPYSCADRAPACEEGL